MIQKILIATLATAAIAFAGPAIAGPGHAGAGAGANVSAGAMGGPSSAGMNAGMNAGLNAGVNSQGSLNASPNSALNRNTTTTTTINPAAGVSQGPANASTTGIAHANSHSVLAGGQVASSTLPGLTTGLTVQSSGGTTLGTVSQVVTDSSGNIRLVIVTTSTGQMLRLSPTSLSISGGVVTTTSI
jgi:hypothetical protein